MGDANLFILEDAALKLQALIDEVVFVGGATLGLLIDSPGAAPIRATTDVDVIAEIMSYSEYIEFSERLRANGFTEDSGHGSPLCRWLHGDLTLDVMPLDRSVLGFTNRWYRSALDHARPTVLPSRRSIRVISAPFFLGTKIEAFHGRGQLDYLGSQDLEDFVAVVDGRDSIMDEIFAAPDDLRLYLAQTGLELLAESRFMDALPGYLLPDEAGQERLPGLLRKLRAIAQM